MSRDPIEETGFVNKRRRAFTSSVWIPGFEEDPLSHSYLFVSNSPISKQDYLGLEDCPIVDGCQTLWLQKPGKKPDPPNGCSIPPAALLLIQLYYDVNIKQSTADNPTGMVSFKPACDTHDNCYSKCCGTKEKYAGRSACDSAIYKDMKKLCEGAKLNKKDLKTCKTVAREMWEGILLGGKKKFIAAQDKVCECQKPNCTATPVPTSGYSH